MQTLKIPLGLSFNDVLLIPQYSKIKSRSEVDLSTQITPHVKLKLPLISSNMTDVTGVKMAIALGKLGALGLIPRFVSAEEEADMVYKCKKEKVLVGAAVGCREGYLERAQMLLKAGCNLITLDLAHGHMQQAITATGKLKQLMGKNCDLVSGVIATYEGAESLFKAGADCVSVGVGPGSICLTRIVTGVGVPQITACLETFRAAKKYKKTIICHGGTKNSGDIVKALACGCSAVICGQQFAGCSEAPGKIVRKNGRLYKEYNGSTSLTEKKNHLKKIASELSPQYLKQIEGIESLVALKGSVKNIVEPISANLRSGLSYQGAINIQSLWEKAKFIRVTPMGLKENGGHNLD